MRDQRKCCGITVHQQVELSDGKPLEEAELRLGPHCPEYPYKPIKKSKKSRTPPNDFNGTKLMGILDHSKPFSLFVWYCKREEDDPDMACVDITIDGKKSPGWLLKSGRKNGICIDKIMYRGAVTPFEFNSSKSQDQQPQLFAGTIQATFWRVMKIDNSNDIMESEDESGMGIEYIPDEGLPALCILNILYRDMNWINMNGYASTDQPLRHQRPLNHLPLKSSLNSELSTTLSSPIVTGGRTYDFSVVEMSSKLLNPFSRLGETADPIIHPKKSLLARTWTSTLKERLETNFSKPSLPNSQFHGNVSICSKENRFDDDNGSNKPFAGSDENGKSRPKSEDKKSLEQQSNNSNTNNKVLADIQNIGSQKSKTQQTPICKDLKANINRPISDSSKTTEFIKKSSTSKVTSNSIQTRFRRRVPLDLCYKEKVKILRLTVDSLSTISNISNTIKLQFTKLDIPAQDISVDQSWFQVKGIKVPWVDMTNQQLIDLDCITVLIN
ncbi:hypothetical protein BC833DRAFT_650774 [Globomyces pollinis-pini]|nr:hypothetical protein BC833DRAFT_650774 [Globomyces pollinis-pini]